MIFYITTPGYNSLSGGSVVLHRLAHILTELGHTAFLLTTSKNSEWLGELHNGLNLDSEGIAVYPEIVSGNPLGLKKVIRWVLYHSRHFGGNGIYGDSDLVYKYTSYYNIVDESKLTGELTIMNDNSSIFKDFGKHIPNKQCYIVKKGNNKIQNFHLQDALCIDDYSIKGGNDYLIKVFNECDTFISYDDSTYISVQAALCGCLSIVVPTESITADYWRNNSVCSKYGIAYGNSELEINHAKTTQHLLRKTVEDLELKGVEQTKQMIEDIKTKWNLI